MPAQLKAQPLGARKSTDSPNDPRQTESNSALLKHLDPGLTLPFHHRMKAAFIALALLVTTALAACDVPPEFSVPVSAPTAIQPDPRLLGDWYGETGEVESLLRVGPSGDDGRLDVLWLFYGSDVPSSYPMIAHASVVDGVTYYNLRRAAGKGTDYTAVGETSGFIIVAPVLIQDNLLLVCVLHGESWSKGYAARMFDAAGLTYRKLTAPQAGVEPGE